jgi:cardiolipin synthase
VDRASAVDRVLRRTAGAPLRRGNGLTLLRNGDQTYADWLGAIERAERWVHVENYIFKADGVGQRFAAALAARARAGLPVRVLYDWFGSRGVPSGFWRGLRASGVDVRTINPPRLGSPFLVLSRDHRKVVGVDGVYGSVGGVGIADPWLERAPDSGLPYRDTSVAVVGPAVADIERAFAGVWDENGPALPDAERPAAGSIPSAGDKAVRVVIQEPGKMRIARVLQVLTADAERRLWIADAYFLADPALREALMAGAGDGLDVRLLLPSTSDVPFVGSLSRASLRPLLEAGVRVFEYGGPMMHAKSTVVDGWWSRVGSTNLNVTGLVTNWEIDLAVEDRPFAGEMEEMFEDDLSHSRELRLGTGRRSPRRSPVRAARELARGGGGQVASTAASLTGTLVQGAATELLRGEERKVARVTTLILLGLAIVAALLPRLIAWPLAAAAGLLAAVGLVRSVGPEQPEGPARAPGGPRRAQAGRASFRTRS